MDANFKQGSSKSTNDECRNILFNVDNDHAQRNSDDGSNWVPNAKTGYALRDGEEYNKSNALLSNNKCSASSALLSNDDSGHETVSVGVASQERLAVVITKNANAGSPVKEYAPPLNHNYPSYITSTPKKDSLLDLRILPSKMILDDPLVSSIDDTSDDDERTSNQVESLNSDEEGTISQLQETKIPANFSHTNAEDLTLTNNNYVVNSLSDSSKDVNKQTSTIMKRFMKDVCIESEFKKGHSITSNVSFGNPEKVKRKIFDVPVSPKLKTRVRERLYSLVNSIEGHKEKIDLEETNNDNIYHREPCSNFHYHTLNQDILQKINPVGIAVNRSHENSFNKMSRMHKDTSFSSDMGSMISERYGNVMAQMLESQLKTLHIQQENLYSDRISLALQKKEQEIQKRISIYREKLQETVEIMEKTELKYSQSEKQLLAERKKHQDELKQLEEKYVQKYRLINQEWEAKLRLSEAKVQSICEEVTTSCNEQVEAVIRGTQGNILGIETNFQNQERDLNTVIYKLRDEIKILESSTESSDLKINNSNLLSENFDLQNQITSNQKRLQIYDENENKMKELEQEVDNCKSENKTLQRELNLCQIEFSKLQQNIRIQNKQPDEMLLTNCLTENKKLAEYVVKLQSELSKNIERVQHSDSLNRKMIQLETTLEGEQRKVRNMQYQHSQEIGVIKKHHETAMLSFRISMDNKQSQAVSDALTHSRKDNLLVTQELEKQYNDLLKNIQLHASAQIEEYKKAVKILKLRIKKMEPKLPPNR